MCSSDLCETNCSETNDALIRRLVKLWNMRLKVGLLAGAVEELAKYGPAKPESGKGIDTIQDEVVASEGGVAADRGANYNPDPSGNRTGEAPPQQLQQVLEKVAQDAKQAVSADQVKNKVPLTVELLEEKLSTIRGAVTMAFPMGLPTFDPVRIAIEDADHSAEIYGEKQLSAETAQLWWASKEFPRDQTVGDRVGRNEKTKIIVKLQQPGSGPPAREPGVTEDERKAMMAHYFRKQEEMKRLADNNEDDFLSSSWADPSALRKQLNGTSNIGFR